MIKKISTPIKNLFSRIAASGDSLMYTMIAIFVVIGPVFFIPIPGFAIGISKGFLGMFLGIIILLISGITILKKGAITIPKSPIFWVLGGIWISSFIGALFAPSINMSLMGYGFGTTTWLFITIFSTCVVVAYKVLKDYRRIGFLYGGMIISFILLFLFQVVRFIGGPAVMSLGILGNTTSSLIGSWGDLGMFFGMILLFSVLTLQLAGLTRIFKWGIALIATISTIALAFMNISIIWIILGIIALLTILYLFAFAYWDTSSKTYKKESRVPWYVLFLFIISVISIFFGPVLNNFAGKHQNITWNDVRPSFKSSVQVMGKTLRHNFATGYGPNTFSLGWSLAKPIALSGNSLADTDFNQGYSYGITQIVMNGLIGAFLWIGFFLLLAYLIIRRMSKGFETSLERYFVVSLSVLVLYLSVMTWVYIPGTFLLLFLAILIGAFIATSVSVRELSFSFIKDPRASFFGIFGITLALVVILFGGYIEIRKAASFAHYAKAGTKVTKGDFSGGVMELTTAINLANHDLYHYQMAQIALGDASKAAASTETLGKDGATKQSEQSLGIALGHAKAATDQNPSNYKNWSLVGDVYRAAVSLGVTEAADLAKKAYAEADKRNPNDTTSILALANLALVSKDISGALGYIKQSIDRYPTKQAYGLKTQIQIGQQNWTGALESLKQLVSFGSSDPLVYVYLGVAYEKTGDMDNAEKIYTMIRKQFTDGDTVITKVKEGLRTEAPAVTPQDVSLQKTEPATVVPVKSVPKTPVAPKVKK